MSSDTALHVSKVGNITRGPELLSSKSGQAYARFGLAVTPYVPKGEPEPDTEFYEVVAFGSLAEHVAESLAKSDRVVIVGNGELESWTDRDGNERVTKKILAEGVGPDLRFVAAQVHRAAQRGQSSAPPSSGEEPF